MTQLLQINSGIFGDDSQSTKLANEFAATWLKSNPNGRVVTRDLVSEPVPHLDALVAGAFHTPADQRTPQQVAAAEFSESLIAEFEQADEVVLGVPMYNFDIPSQLKAYFDQLARAGISFKYTETGPVGLLRDKPVHLMAARGGLYQGQSADTQTGFLRNFLNFIGIQDIHFVYAEGLNMGPESADIALTAARQNIQATFA